MQAIEMLAFAMARPWAAVPLMVNAAGVLGVLLSLPPPPPHALSMSDTSAARMIRWFIFLLAF